MQAFQVFLAGLGLMVAYLASQVVHRLFLHPLSRFPGPTMLAITSWWEFVIETAGGGGVFYGMVDRWHDRYGGAVRVGPNEVHIRDPDFLNVLYSVGKVRDKDPNLAHAFGTAQGTFGAIEHSIHKARRGALSTFFTKRSVQEKSGRIRDKVEVLSKIFADSYNNGNSAAPFDVRPIFVGWSIDSVTWAFFGMETSVLEHEDQRFHWFELSDSMLAMWPLMKQAPFLLTLPIMYPRSFISFAKKYAPAMVPTLRMFIQTEDMAVDRKRAYDVSRTTQEKASEFDKPIPADVFSAILSSALPESEKEPARMAHEASEILSAASGSSSRTMNFATYHILANPLVLEQLRKELDATMPDPSILPDASVINSLPYLKAVAKECLRMAASVTFRFALIAPNETLMYDGKALPPGVVVSMNPPSYLLDPTIFDDPETFRPERWLASHTPPEMLARYDKFFLPFGLGSRQCIGMHFATTQIHYAIAAIFRRFELRLHDVVRERDIDHKRVWAVAEPSKETHGIHVVVTGIRS